MTKKFFQVLFLALFLVIFLSRHTNAVECKQVKEKLNVDGTWTDYDTFYNFSGGNITFKLNA